MVISIPVPFTRCVSKQFVRATRQVAASQPFLDELFSLHGRSAIVTGGGSGIGLALSEALVRAGAAVVITGRREGVLETARDRILRNLMNGQIELTPADDEKNVSTPSRIAFHPCDITNYEQLPVLVRETENMTGIPPTILINNAGLNVRQEAGYLTSEHWNESLSLMLIAPFMLSRAMAGNMKGRQHGRIINIASLQSYMAFPNSIPYAAAKSGILGLTRSLSEAYSPPHGYHNVTSNAIAPGYVKTDLTESVFADGERSQKLADRTLLGRNSLPNDLTGVAVFLASPASAYVTGQTLIVDGGFTALGMR